MCVAVLHNFYAKGCRFGNIRERRHMLRISIFQSLADRGCGRGELVDDRTGAACFNAESLRQDEVQGHGRVGRNERKVVPRSILVKRACASTGGIYLGTCLSSCCVGVVVS